MKIEYKFCDGLIELMKKTPLDQITVVMLSNHIGSNRQTFYYHFRDIGDVIDSILYQDKKIYLTKIFDFEQIIKPIVAYTNSNYQFLRAITLSFASDRLLSFYSAYFYKQINIYLRQNKFDKEIGQISTRHICRYLSTIFAKEMFNWVSEKQEESQKILVQRLRVIWNYFIKQYYSDLRGTR